MHACTHAHICKGRMEGKHPRDQMFDSGSSMRLRPSRGEGPASTGSTVLLAAGKCVAEAVSA